MGKLIETSEAHRVLYEQANVRLRRVVELHRAGHTYVEIGRLLAKEEGKASISPQQIGRLMNRARARGFV